MQEGMGFCFIFWLLSIKDEGSLGFLNQKFRGAVTLFWVQIMRNEKRTGCPPVLKRKFLWFKNHNFANNVEPNKYFFLVYMQIACLSHEIAGPNWPLVHFAQGEDG